MPRESFNYPTMFEEVVTMIRILSLIPQDRWTTVAEIHDELTERGIEIHRRTLQRYLKTIREHSEVFPIVVNSSGKPFTFCWDPQSAGFHLPQLGVEQMLLLRMAEEHLHATLPAQAITALRPLLRSARRIVQYDDESRGTWLRKVKVLDDAQRFMPPAIRPAVLSAVADALFIDHKLMIRCRSTKKREDVVVRPLALIQKGVRTYLVYQTDGEEVIQHIALNRIEAAELLQDMFVRPKSFDLEDYAAKVSFNESRGTAVRLTIVSDDPEFVRMLSESPFNLTQSIEDAGEGKWSISAIVEDSLLLDGWLAERRASILSSTKAALTDAEIAALTRKQQTPDEEEDKEKRSTTRSRPRGARQTSGTEVELTQPKPKSYDIAAAEADRSSVPGLEFAAELKTPSTDLVVTNRKVSAS